MIDHKVRYFIAVVEEGSFSAAAKKLYVSQSALSKQIRILEKNLGFCLLSREGYRPSLTNNGKKYYSHVVNLVKQYDELVSELRDSVQLKLSIAFSGAYEHRAAIQVMNELKRKKLISEMNFVQCRFGEGAEKLENGQVDLCFGLESAFHSFNHISYKVLYPFEMCVICSFDYPLAQYSMVHPKQLENEPIIALSEYFGQDFYRKYLDAWKMDHTKPNIVKKVDYFDELVAEVAIGNGIAIVSKDVVRTNEVKVIELIQSNHHENSVLAYRKEREVELHSIVGNIEQAFQEYNQKD